MMLLSSPWVDRTKYFIQIPLPPKIDPTVSMMQVEEKPDITYADVGGAKEQVEKVREVVELPLLHPKQYLVCHFSVLVIGSSFIKKVLIPLHLTTILTPGFFLSQKTPPP
eukprot:EG_transcript_57515